MSSGPGLQPERTSLAWRRTGLVAVAATLALGRAAATRGSTAIAALSGVLLLGAVATLWQGIGPHADAADGDDDAITPQSLPRAAPLTVAVTVLLAVAGLMLLLST